MVALFRKRKIKVHSENIKNNFLEDPIISKLSLKTKGFREINGASLPDVDIIPLVESKILLDIINNDGKRVVVTKGTRRKKSRVGIHIHKYGGYTLNLSGKMTDFVQGLEIKKYEKNTGYYMKPNTPMSAANLEDEDATLIDIFIVPHGEPYINILEPEWKFNRIGI